ncbi:MAG: discoidin domain-containing protein, partial [Catenulispora sp.]
MLAVSCSRPGTDVARRSASQNFAQGQPASQSSTAFSGSASRAVDGNSNGNWGANSVSHTDYNRNAWWQVDLGQTVAITSVVLWGRTDCCTDRLSDFYVFVSAEPFASTDLADTQQQAGVASVHVSGRAQT